MESTKSCPKCASSAKVVKVVFGKPSDAQVKEAKEGKVFLANTGPSSKKWRCKKCDFSFE
jgi:hypothetical protein